MFPSISIDVASAITLLAVLPAAHHTHDLFKALQLYDAQDPTQVSPIHNKTSLLSRVLLFLPTALILVYEIFVFATPGIKLCPTLTYLRGHFTSVLMLGLLYAIARTTIRGMLTPPGQTFVSRSTKEPCLAQVQGKTRAPLLSGRSFLALVYGVAYTAMAVEAWEHGSETNFIAVLIGVTLVTMTYASPPPPRNGWLSFRGAALYPLVFFLAILAFVFLEVLFIHVFSDDAPTLSVGSSEATPASPSRSFMDTWAENLLFDGEITKLAVFFVTLGNIFITTFSVALIGLGYRYDAETASSAVLSTPIVNISGEALTPVGPMTVISPDQNHGETEMTIFAATEKDEHDRRPIQFASVTSARLSFRQRTTFNAGFFALALVHLACIVYRLRSSGGPLLLAKEDIPVWVATTYSAIPPGHVALPFVLVAMLLAATRTPKGAKGLWTYAEKWGIDKKPRDIETVGEAKKERLPEAESLL